MEQMTLSYPFTLSESATLSLYTLLDECTYAYSFQSLLYLYSQSKEYVHCWGWGGLNHASSQYGTVSLSKGSYVARIHIRHESASTLESMKNLPLTMEFTLSKPVAATLYASLKDAVEGGKKGQPIFFIVLILSLSLDF
jgi:hypothetical protein